MARTRRNGGSNPGPARHFCGAIRAIAECCRTSRARIICHSPLFSQSAAGPIMIPLEHCFCVDRGLLTFATQAGLGHSVNMGPQMAASSAAKLCTTLRLPAVFVLMSRHHAAGCLHSTLQCLWVMRQGTKNIRLRLKTFRLAAKKGNRSLIDLGRRRPPGSTSPTPSEINGFGHLARAGPFCPRGR